MRDLENQIFEYPDCALKDILDSLAYQIIVADFPKKKVFREREHRSEPDFEEELARLTARQDAISEYHDAIF